MNTNHSEWELKFDAAGVDEAAFLDFAYRNKPEKYEHVTNSPDVYYRQGSNVCRHRVLIGEAGELTVKQRKSDKSTNNRVEIDLRFAAGTTIGDIQEYLKATGWKREFTIQKEAHIFWGETPRGSGALSKSMIGYSLVFYTVAKLGKNGWGNERKFIEIEVEKGQNIDTQTAMGFLHAWRTKLQTAFPSLGPNVNDSLYEIYSGKRYKKRS